MADVPTNYPSHPAGLPSHAAGLPPERAVSPGGTPMEAHKPERGLGDLLRELRDETSLLVKQEVALFKTEATEKASKLGRNLGYLLVGGTVVLAGGLVLLFALARGLEVLLVEMGMALGTAVWLAPLIVGLLVIVIGYALVDKAISTLREESAVPEKTVETLKEDKEWAQAKLQ